MRTTIKAFNENVEIELKTDLYHQSKRLCIIAYVVEDNQLIESWGKVTVNVPEIPLEENEIIVKVHSENEWVLQLLNLLPDVFRDTQKRIASGFVELQVWKLMKNIP